MPTEIETLKAKCETLEEAAKVSNTKREEAETDANKQRIELGEHLEKLLAQQRRSFEDQLESLKGKMQSSSGDHDVLVTGLREELKVAKVEAVQLTAQVEEVKKDLVAAKAAIPPPKLPEIELPEPVKEPEEDPEPEPLMIQLARALQANAARVIDLFQKWDTDGDGEVTRAEVSAVQPSQATAHASHSPFPSPLPTHCSSTRRYRRSA